MAIGEEVSDMGGLNNDDLKFVLNLQNKIGNSE